MCWRISGYWLDLHHHHDKNLRKKGSQFHQSWWNIILGCFKYKQWHLKVRVYNGALSRPEGPKSCPIRQHWVHFLFWVSLTLCLQSSQYICSSYYSYYGFYGYYSSLSSLRNALYYQTLSVYQIFKVLVPPIFKISVSTLFKISVSQIFKILFPFLFKISICLLLISLNSPLF